MIYIMDQATWLKQKQSTVEAALKAEPKQIIFVSCRDLVDYEKKLLSKNFPRVIDYTAGLNGEMDLSKIAFDLLFIDVRRPENHLFLEIVKPSCTLLNIPIIVLKRKFSNCKELVSELGPNAYSLYKIEDLEGPNFFFALVKSKLPKLESRIWTLLKKLLRCF